MPEPKPGDIDRLILGQLETLNHTQTKALTALDQIAQGVAKLNVSADATVKSLLRIEDRLSHIENDKLEDIKLGVAPINNRDDRIAMLLGRLVTKQGA